jgi:capsular polysaccharide biosynthesis protein
MDVCKEIALLFKKEKWIIIASVLVFFFVGSIFASGQADQYNGSYYFTLKKAPIPKQSNFENYYHIQVAEKLSDFLAGWLGAQVRNDPDVSAVADFSSRMVSFEVVGIKFTAKNQEEAEQLYEKTEQFMQKKVQQLNADIFAYEALSSRISQLVLLKQEPQRLPYTVGSIFLGLCVGIFAAVTKHYFRKA